MPGHFERITDPHGMIDIQLQRIQDRKMECLEHIKKGKQEAGDLFQEMYPKGRSLPGLNMLIGYLDLLEEEGKIRIDESLTEKKIILLN